MGQAEKELLYLARQGREMKHSTSKLSIFFISIFLMVPVMAMGQDVFYVDPSGNDSNAGTQAQPLQTFQGAVNKVRTAIDGNGDITVNFNSGNYTFDSTVVLGPLDSGSADQTITYQATPGHRPVFSSLVRVTGWTTYSGEIMQADLPGGITHVRYLHDESEDWMERSSTPFFRPAVTASCGGAECEHWEPDAQIRKTYTIYPSSFSMPDASKGSQYDLRVHMTAWHAQVLPISGINTATRRIDLATPSHYPIVNGIDDLLSECWVLNSIEGIDSAGEWASIDGKIYLWPISGTSDIFVPALEELIRLDAGGDGNTWTGTPVQHINFEGITFTGCDYRAMQATDVCTQHEWQMIDVDEGLLRLRNAANCSITNCVFTKSGCDGVRLDRYAQNITVNNCEFSYLGKGGVLLDGRGPGYGDVNMNNTVSNSHFNKTSQIKWDAACVHIDQSSSNLIKQNYFEDIPLSAIIISGCRESNLAEAQAPGVVNKDFHWAEVRPDLIDSPWGAAAEFYDHDNMVEENTFRSVHIGTSALAQAITSTAPGFMNGMIYTTGRKAGATDSFNKNYFYDSDPTATGSQTWVILGDGHEDYLDFHQNMIFNVLEGGGLEPSPIMSNNCSAANGCRATANVVENSTHAGLECGICQNPSYAGNIDFDSGSPGGSSSFVNEYEEMWSLLCPGALPGPSPLPGSSTLQSSLASKIISFGGTVPTCAATCSVPNVVGQTQLTAKTNIVAAGLIVGNVTSQSGTTVPAGKVISQNPGPGNATCSDAVDLVVSTGSVAGGMAFIWLLLFD